MLRQVFASSFQQIDSKSDTSLLCLPNFLVGLNAVVLQFWCNNYAGLFIYFEDVFNVEFLSCQHERNVVIFYPIERTCQLLNANTFPSFIFSDR